MRIVALAAVGVAPELELAFVPPEKLRIIIVRAHLVEVTEPFVESVAIRDAGRSFVAQSPFADGRRFVGGGLQEFRHGQVLRRQRHARVSANARMSGVPTGHQAATRGRADGASGIALSEAHSFLRQPIYVRSPNLLLAVTAEVAITKVVRQNENDVGFVRRTGLEPAEIRSLRLG